MRTKRGRFVSRAFPRPCPSSFCNEDETRSFRLPGICTIVLDVKAKARGLAAACWKHALRARHTSWGLTMFTFSIHSFLFDYKSVWISRRCVGWGTKCLRFVLIGKIGVGNQNVAHWKRALRVTVCGNTFSTRVERGCFVFLSARSVGPVWRGGIDVLRHPRLSRCFPLRACIHRCFAFPLSPFTHSLSPFAHLLSVDRFAFSLPHFQRVSK